MMLAVVISGVVIFAVVALASVAFSLVLVLLDRRRRPFERQTRFLEGLRRISSRVAGSRTI